MSVSAQNQGHADMFYGNKVVMTGSSVGNFGCSGAGQTVVHSNAYFTASGQVTECHMDLATWQARAAAPRTQPSEITHSLPHSTHLLTYYLRWY